MTLRTIMCGAATALLVFAAAPASAQFVSDVLPPFEIATIVRSMGLDPLHRPAWQRGRYVLRAIDRYGEEVRVIVDARSGAVLSVQPVTGYRDPAPYPRQAARPMPQYAPPPGEDEFDEDESAAMPPLDEPPVISAPRRQPVAKPAPRSAAIAPGETAPLPRARPQIEETEKPQESQPSQAAQREPEPPPVPQGKVRHIEIYKKPEEPKAEPEKPAEPPLSPLEETKQQPNL